MAALRYKKEMVATERTRRYGSCAQLDRLRNFKQQTKGVTMCTAVKTEVPVDMEGMIVEYKDFKYNTKCSHWDNKIGLSRDQIESWLIVMGISPEQRKLVFNKLLTELRGSVTIRYGLVVGD